jgi:hypothetical protein
MVAVTATPAAAQGADIGLGYQFLRGDGESVPLGFNFDVAYPIMNQLSVVGEVGWSHDSESEFGIDASLNAVNFGAGIRWSGNYDPRFTPFAQVILGAQRDSYSVEGFEEFDDSTTNFILQPGGGVSFKLNDMWGVFGQVDYRRIFYEGEGTNAFRLVLGARVNLR